MKKTTINSLKINMVLNAVKGLMGIFFPLISFPYISRVLGVERIGSFNFSNSVISYFVLLAGLGIAPYAIREGAKFRNDSRKLESFVNEIFSINIFSTILSFVLLFVLIVVNSKIRQYYVLMLILSLQIVFKTIGIEWFFSIYEDYLYITIRSIIFQILSLILMFLFVHKPADVAIYAAISVVSAAGSNLMNFFYARKFCKIHFTAKIHWNKHMAPILILFATSVTLSIYVSSDMVILGFLCNDYHVGLYSFSVKIYSIIKTVLSSIILVSVPRMSYTLANNGLEKFKAVATDIYKIMWTTVPPAAVGLIVLYKQIILIIANDSYLAASASLIIIAAAIPFYMCAYFWSQCILVPLGEEKSVFYATLISAIMNIILNFIFIPIYAEKAAALSTLLSEAFVYVWCMIKSRKYIAIEGIWKTLWKVGLGCAEIVGVVLLLGRIIKGTGLYTAIAIIISVAAYGAVELLLKNDVVKDLYDKVIIKLKRHD